MKSLPYLEQFVATRRRVEDLSVDPQVGGGCTDLPGFVYADRFFIEIEPDGSYYLPLVQEEHRATGDDGLAELEGLLFEYAVQHEDLGEQDCHDACVARHLPCPKVCRICGGAS